MLKPSNSPGYSLLQGLPSCDLVNASMEGNQCGSFLLSFQNSGNHLVRAFLECMWRRPTIGCPQNRFNDSLIFANNNLGLAYYSVYPIACKGHTVSDLYHHYSSSSLCGPGLIFITRNPIDVMISYSRHVRNPLKSFKQNNFSFVGLIKALYRLFLNTMSEKQIKDFIELIFLNYLQLVDFFLNYQGPKIHLMFEQLVDPEVRLESFERLVDWHKFEIATTPVHEKISEAIDFVDKIGRISLSRKGLGPCNDKESILLVTKLIKASMISNASSFQDALNSIEGWYPIA